MDRKKIERVTLIFAIPLFISFFLYNFFKIYESRKESRAANFSGLIEKIVYEEPKHLPTITVKGNEYDVFDYYWGPDTLAVGDSVIKKKGSLDLALFKRIKY